MFHYQLHLLLTVNYLFYAWIICIQVNCFTQIIKEQHLVEQNDSNYNNDNDSSNPNGCIDSDGIWHGLFSTWMENPTCWCTCQPVSRMAVSICDGCEVNKSENNNVKLNHKDIRNENIRNDSLSGMFNTHDTGRMNGNEVNQKRSADIYHEYKTQTENSNSCYYAVTNTYYQHKDIWMSAELPCVKCKCQHGNVHCAGEPHQCPSICLPGQYSQPAGPCCHTVCKGTVSKNVTFEFASCLKLGVDTLHSHGEMITLSGICVDQKCQCVNGRWNCFDYCTPLSELSCPSNEMIIWDPFCCPRCRGDQACSVNVDMKNWLINPNEQTPIVNTFERLELTSLEWSKSLINQQQGQEILHESSVDNTVNTELITIQPGQQIVLEQGHCFCLNASIYCPRPGRLIWHEDDCFYMNEHEISYHSIGTRWIPNGDHCTECICEINRTYRCKRQSCQQLFLCPPEQIPMTSEDECCPSYCGLPSQKNQEKSSNSNQFIQKNNELNIGSSKSGNRVVDKLVSETLPQKPSSLSSLNTGCSSMIDNENIIQYPNVFPSGSRLLLIRPCRSLLCICASDNRWVCTDHCPPCEQSMESIENLRQVLLPPKDKCCELCNEKAKATTVQVNNQINQNEFKSQQEFITQTRNQTNSYYSNNEQIHKDYISTEIKQLKLTLKMYILIFSIILICTFGLPICILIGCYLMKTRYNNNHRHRYHQYKRKNEYHQYTTHATPSKTPRSRYHRYYHRCYSRVKPFFIKPHNDDCHKDQSELEASIQSPLSVSSSSSTTSRSLSSSPVLILKESYNEINNRENCNLTTSLSSTMKVTKVKEAEHNPKSNHYHHLQYHTVNADNKQKNTVMNTDEVKLAQPTLPSINLSLNELANSNTTVSVKGNNSKSYNLVKKFRDHILSSLTTATALDTKGITNSPLPVIIQLKPSCQVNTLKQQKQTNLVKSLSASDNNINCSIYNNNSKNVNHKTEDMVSQYEVKSINRRIFESHEKTNRTLNDLQKSPKEILLKNLVLTIDNNNSNKNNHTTYSIRSSNNKNRCMPSNIKSEPCTPNIFMHNVTFNSYYSANCSSSCCSPSSIIAVNDEHSSQKKGTIQTILPMQNSNYQHYNNKLTNSTEQEELDNLESDRNRESTILGHNAMSRVVNKTSQEYNTEVTHTSKVIEDVIKQQQVKNSKHNEKNFKEIFSIDDRNNNDDTSLTHLPLCTYYQQRCDNINSEQHKTVHKKQNSSSGDDYSNNSRTRSVTWPIT
ncbi:von Willebrand factor type C [Schistosoma japonicum]|nr:von Willebrand factor type C [Schistosoma japonicum]